MSKRAYITRCSDDDHGCSVAYAESNAKARQQGNGDLCDCEYLDLRARLAPEFDQYYPNGPTLKQLVEDHNWWARCLECGEATFAEDVAEWVGDDLVCKSCAALDWFLSKREIM